MPRIKVYLSITTFAYHTKMRIDYWNVSTLLGSGIDGPDNYCFLQLQRDLYRYKLDFLALSDGSMKRTPPPLTTLPYYALKSLTEARVNFGCLTCEFNGPRYLSPTPLLHWWYRIALLSNHVFREVFWPETSLNAERRVRTHDTEQRKRVQVSQEILKRTEAHFVNPWPKTRRRDWLEAFKGKLQSYKQSKTRRSASNNNIKNNS